MWNRHETQAQPCAAPPRYKRALLTFVGLLGPVYLVPPALRSLIPGHPMAVVPLAVACIVVLMTYLIMPALQRLCRPWLHASPKRPAEHSGGAAPWSSPGRGAQPKSPAEEPS